jgi:drug/metabolite transporter (DMT)-like permease
MAGIAVLARPSGSGSVLPILVVLGASVSWGVGSVLAGRLPAPATLLGGAVVVASVAMLLINRDTSQPRQERPGRAEACDEKF